MKPLIFDFAVTRKGDTSSIYEYDFEQSVNTITTETGKKLFIESTSKDISLLTKSRIRQEDDDTDLTLEIKTKTEAAKERDDHSYSLLELQTKTFTKTERDDESFGNYQ